MDELYGATGEAGDAPAPRPGADQAPDTSHSTHDQASQAETRDKRAEPLTRGEYADLMRQGGSFEEDDNPDDSEISIDRETIAYHSTSNDLAEPRTRQEAADEARAVSWDGPDPAEDSQDLALAAMNADTARPEGANIGPLADTAGQQDAEEGELDRPNPSFSFVQASDRTLGDNAPTGIGLKPTGEQLADMDGDEPAERRADRLFTNAFERMDDLHDAAGHIAETVDPDLAPGPAAHPSAHSTHTSRELPPQAAPGVGDAVGNLAVIAVMTAASIRYLLGHRRKEHEP